ncbi:MAG: YcaO-like family protein [Fidelibacterota bacterium]
MTKKFNSSIKTFKKYKVCHPQQTIDRINSAFTKIGLKSFVKTWAKKGVYISVAWLENDILVTSGKGATVLLSEASALGELVERFSANWLIEYDVNLLKYQQHKYSKNKKWSLAELKTNKADLDFFIQSVQNGKLSEGSFQLINNFPFHWETAYSLTQEIEIDFPYFWFRASQGTNGIASGNSLEEATLHAISEVVERHNLRRMIDGQLALPTIDPKSIKNPELIAVMACFQSIDIDFIIKDCTLGMPLPTIVVVFNNKKHQTDNEYLKTVTNNLIAGTDTDPEIAALRCFTEYIQGYKDAFSIASEFIKKWHKLGLTYKAKKEDDFAYQILKNKRIYDIDFLLKTDEIIPISALPNKFNIDNLVELENCIADFKKINIDLWFMDFTHPVLGFPVALVISPQMQIKGLEYSITDVFSKLALQRKMIDPQDKSFELIKQNIAARVSLEEHLLVTDWYKSKVGIRETINKLEAHICNFPMELDFFFDKFVYEILVYLHLNIGNYKRTKLYNSLLSEFFKIIPNKQKVHEMMHNFARVEYYLENEVDMQKNPKSNGILKIMSASGVSFDVDRKWKNIGYENSAHPFNRCDFNCENCQEFDDICVWKKVNVEDMV